MVVKLVGQETICMVLFCVGCGRSMAAVACLL
jgi:hypothetical protein